MLNKLVLKNFKCYKNQKIDFSNLTVFSGINGAGKSTVIQALLFLRQLVLSDNRNGDHIDLNGPLVRFGNVYDLMSNWITADESVDFLAEESNGETFSITLKEIDKISHVEEKYIRQMELSKKEGQKIASLSGEDFVYLSAERSGPRVSFEVPPDAFLLNKFGASGEFTAWHICNTKQIKNKKLLEKMPDNSTNDFLCQLSTCYSELGKETKITVQYLPNVERISLSYSFAGIGGWGKDFKPINVGFGLTYSLPIFTALLMAKENDLVIIENPEAHLHPKGQVAIGMFIAKAASAGIQVIIETHSDHVLNGIRLAVKRKIIPNTLVKLNFVTNNYYAEGATILTPAIMDNGRIDEWPDGFFDEYENVLAEFF